VHTQKNLASPENSVLWGKYWDTMLRIRAAEGISCAGAARLAGAVPLQCAGGRYGPRIVSVRKLATRIAWPRSATMTRALATCCCLILTQDLVKTLWVSGRDLGFAENNISDISRLKVYHALRGNLIASGPGLRYDRPLASVLRVTQIIPPGEPHEALAHTQKIWNRWKHKAFEGKDWDTMLRNRAAEGISYAGASQLACPAHL